MGRAWNAEAEDIDFEFYDEIEATFEEILSLVSEARNEERVPGCGPDRPDDVVAVLVSQRYKDQLDLPSYRYLEPLSEYEDILQVPLVPFAPLEEDYAPLLRRDVEAFFDALAETGLAREELRIAEHVLAEHERLEHPLPHLPETLMWAVEQAWPGDLDAADWPAA